MMPVMSNQLKKQKRQGVECIILLTLKLPTLQKKKKKILTVLSW